MKLPNFPLAPWEVPLDAEVARVAPADYVVHGAWRDAELLVRTIETPRGRFAYAREASSDEVGNWLIPQYTWQPQFDVEDYLRREPNPDFERHFNLDGALYGRRGWHFLRLGLREGHWSWNGQHARFRAPDWRPQEFFDLSANRAEHLVRDWLKHSHCEARVAFDWLHFDAAQRQSCIFGISAPEIEHIQRLMTQILHANRALWTEPSPSEPYSGERYHLGFSYRESEARPWEFLQLSSAGPLGLRMPARIKKWRELILRHLAPSPRDNEFLCLQNASEGRIEIVANEPNAHEQVEAHVALCEWLHGVGEGAQIAELMQGEAPRVDWNSIM